MKNIKRKITIVSFAIVVIILIASSVYSSQKKATTTPIPIVITSYTPIENSLEVSVFDPITIVFNQPVDPLSITITSNPPENWTTKQTAPNTIEVDHNLYLKVSTSYKLTVSQSGNVIGTLNFETSHDQNDPRQLQSLKSELDKNYPLASLTPYETPNYRVVYSAPLTIEIDVKSSVYDKETAISEVQSWVKSNGIDPATHKYNVIIKPSTP